MPVQFQGALVKRRQLLVDILVVNVALYTQKDKGKKKMRTRTFIGVYMFIPRGLGRSSTVRFQFEVLQPPRC